MLKRIAWALCAVLMAGAPAMAQYPLQPGPVPYVSSPAGTPSEGANFAISAVNKYLSGQYGGVAIVNPTFTGTLSGPLLNFNGTNAVANLGGSQAMYIGGNLNGSVFVGVSAGNGYTGLYNTGVGTQVLASITTGGEDTGLGTTACALLTVAVFDTCLGQHALGYETSASSATAVGNDSQRNLVSTNATSATNSFNTSIGKSAMSNGSAIKQTAIGAQALNGASGNIFVAGTKTTGDVIQIKFTGSFTGSPQYVTYTVQSGDTIDTIAANLATAISSALLATPENVATGSFATFATYGYSIIQLVMPGTSTTGYGTTATGVACNSAGATNGVCNGSAGSETLSFAGGSAGFDNIGIGFNACFMAAASSTNSDICVGDNTGLYMTTAVSDVLIGSSAGQYISSSFFDVCIGTATCEYLTTNGFQTSVGYNAGQNNTGGNSVFLGAIAGFNVLSFQNTVLGSQAVSNANNANGYNITAVGYRAGFNLTSGPDTIIGGQVGQTIASATGDILIGSGNVTVEPPTATTSNFINIENVYVNSSTAPTITTAQALGATPTITAKGAHVFKAVVGASPTGTTETISLPTAPTGWMCVANDLTTSSNTAKITTSSTTGVTLTWSATPTASDVILHMCDAY